MHTLILNNSNITFKDNRIISIEKIDNNEGCAMDIQEKLPKTQRSYWSPETCTFVSYTRARQLGLDTDKEEEEVYIPGEENKLYKNKK